MKVFIQKLKTFGNESVMTGTTRSITIELDDGQRFDISERHDFDGLAIYSGNALTVYPQAANNIRISDKSKS